MAFFSLLIGLGAALGVWQVAQCAPPRETGRWVDAALISLLLALLGARAVYVALEWSYYAAQPLEIFQVGLGGLAWLGAALGWLVSVLLVALLWRIPLGAAADGLSHLLAPLAPFLFLLLLMGKLSFKSLFLVPAVYVITCLPAWIIGRNLGELLLLYPNQVESFDQLTLNAPTFYALIDNSVNYLFNNAGVIVAGALVMLAVYAVYKLRPNLTPDLIVTLAAVCLLLIVYLLPKMHERYFFPAEVFFLVAAFYRPRLAWVVVALQITTLSTYVSYFFGGTFLPLPIASLVNLAVLVVVMMDAGRLVMANRVESAKEVSV